MRAIPMALVFGLVWCVLCSAAPAATVTLEGTEAGFWHDKVVVECRLTKVQWARPRTLIRVKVLAVIATDVPVPTDAELEMTASFAPHSGLFGLSSGDDLKEGATVLLVVRRDPEGWSVPEESLRFFLSNCAIQVFEKREQSVYFTNVDNMLRVRRLARRADAEADVKNEALQALREKLKREDEAEKKALLEGQPGDAGAERFKETRPLKTPPPATQPARRD